MFFIYAQVNLPDTFGGIAKYLLRSLMNHDCQETHFVTNERDQRGSSSMTYRINGVEQNTLAIGCKTEEFKF